MMKRNPATMPMYMNTKPKLKRNLYVLEGKPMIQNNKEDMTYIGFVSNKNKYRWYAYNRHLLHVKDNSNILIFSMKYQITACGLAGNTVT